MTKFWFMLVCSWFLVSESQGLEFYLEEFKSWYLFENEWQGTIFKAMMTCYTHGYDIFIPTSAHHVQAVFNKLPPEINESWVGIYFKNNPKALYNYRGSNLRKGSVHIKLQTTMRERIHELNWVKPLWFYDSTNSILVNKNGTYSYLIPLHELHFICEKNDKEPISENEIDEMKKEYIKNGYIYVSDYDALYKVQGLSSSYSDALFLCLKDKASIVIPESQEEAAYLFTLLPFNYKDLVWIGATLIDNDHFMTYDGRSLKDTYVKWAKDQPKNYKNCTTVIINGDGTYETRKSCYWIRDKYIPLVCKKKLPETVQRNSYIKNDSTTIITSKEIISETDSLYLTFRLNEFQTSYLFDERMETSFLEAVRACAIKGYTLFRPRSNHEIAKVFKVLPSRITDIWVGIYALQHDDYQSMFGDKMEEINWYNKKRFRKKNVKLNRDGMYRDVHEATSLQYICSKTEESPINEEETEKFKEPYLRMGYTYWEDHDALYKLHDEATLDLAALTCKREKASLIVPESKTEADDIFSLFTINNEEVWIDAVKTDIGFITFEGKPLTDFYMNVEKENCVPECGGIILKTEGIYHPTISVFRYPVICKKKIPRIKFGDDANRPGYITKFKSWYWFDEKSKKSFLGAVTSCLTRGYSLFTPRLDSEAEAIFNKLPSAINEIWIGTYATRFNVFQTIEGEAWTTTKWPEYRILPMEDCVKMFRNGTYLDIEDDEKLHYVCRKREDTKETITEENAEEMKKVFSKKGYIYWNDYKASYKRYSHKNHLMSLSVCLNDSATLFTPESREEAITVFKKLRISELWIGAAKNDQNVYVTYEGKPLNDTFMNWDSEYADNCNWNKEGCDFVKMNENAYLEKTSVDERLKFVCKKKLPITTQGSTDNFSLLGPMFAFNESRRYYFYDALMYCAIHGKTLFFPKDEYEMIWLFEHLPPSINQIWVGVSSYQMKSFYSITGDKFKDKNVTWTYTSKDFLSVSRNGVYNDLDNEVSLPFVCKKTEDLTMSSLRIKWFFSNKGYVFSEDYDTMYKNYDDMSSFSALLKCMLDGATLFVPESLNEVKYVFESLPLVTIWVGTKRFENDTFHTYDGLPFDILDLKWNAGQPDNCEFCDFISINRNYTYETANGSQHRPFVCKKKIYEPLKNWWKKQSWW